MLGFSAMRTSLRGTATALLTASVLAVFEIFRISAARVFEGRPIDIHLAGHRLILMWLTVVLVSPWCAWMARRFPFGRGRTGRTLLAHFGGACVFVAAHMMLMLGLHFVFTREPFPLGFTLLHMYAFYIAMEMSVYVAIVLVLLLIDARAVAAERALASSRLEQGLTAARLEGLRAQIRPHFLFNTLNALAVLARRGDGAAVDRAIGDLGELLRASFDSEGRQEIRLAEELDFLERYVSLQRIRFPDRLEVAWSIEEATREALVPAMVVQPLVENAIEHGLATARGGRVRVASRRDGDALAIEVADDGPGFGAPSGTADHHVPANGIGLSNTRERLALLYGDRGSLSVGDLPGGGGVVRLRIPWRSTDTAR
jgi:signal transduction histidine kinase